MKIEAKNLEDIRDSTKKQMKTLENEPKKIKSKTIPLKVLKCNVNIHSIGKIFEYDIRADSIKIKNIKNDVKDEIVQVYSDLVSNGMI